MSRPSLPNPAFTIDLLDGGGHFPVIEAPAAAAVVPGIPEARRSYERNLFYLLLQELASESSAVQSNALPRRYSSNSTPPGPFPATERFPGKFPGPRGSDGSNVI